MEKDYVLAKWLSGEMTGEELRAFENSLEFETYRKIVHYSGQMEAPGIDESTLYQGIKSKTVKPVKVISLHERWWFKVAAMVVLFAGVVLFYKTNIAVQEMAENGTQTQFTLPDNSEVVMNAGSEIDYNKWDWKNNRELDLLGEAYFKVAKGKKFSVKTPLGTVRVLGTQFNVKARESRFDVSCYEGRVAVNYQNFHLIITKGQRLIFENGTYTKTAGSDLAQPEWLSGELSFSGENLEAILQELERHYDCKIQSSDITSDQRFTGSLPGDNLESSLKILSSIYHLKYSRSNKNITLEPLHVEE